MNEKFIETFNVHFEKIEKELEKSIFSNIPLIDDICRHSLLGAGKRLRPLLFVISALMCGYKKKDIYRFSTMFEYIHCASLLHDDVIDNADIRRKKPSASNLWGNTAAVLAGDYMFSMASRIALGSKRFEILTLVTNTAACMTEGQVRELICTGKWETSEEEYLEIIISKTADLISASCAAGAVMAGAKKEDVENLKDFGLNMGIAFQMIDDLLDYSSSEEEFGKPVGKDFKEGKITLPLIYTIKEMTEDEAEKYKELLLNRSKSEADHSELINLVRSSGNIEKTKRRAQEYVAKAAEFIKKFPASDYRDNLISLN
ncbi:MAG: polyprenyl synthetase family protein, partial [Candidatus Aminicenantes bacterium]|nr:polyprenyl synthetase family protein [Candidatus Aminicenantes bacterium]